MGDQKGERGCNGKEHRLVAWRVASGFVFSMVVTTMRTYQGLVAAGTEDEGGPAIHEAYKEEPGSYELGRELTVPWSPCLSVPCQTRGHK